MKGGEKRKPSNKTKIWVVRFWLMRCSASARARHRKRKPIDDIYERQSAFEVWFTIIYGLIESMEYEKGSQPANVWKKEQNGEDNVYVWFDWMCVWLLFATLWRYDTIRSTMSQVTKRTALPLLTKGLSLWNRSLGTWERQWRSENHAGQTKGRTTSVKLGGGELHKQSYHQHALFIYGDSLFSYHNLHLGAHQGLRGVRYILFSNI